MKSKKDNTVTKDGRHKAKILTYDGVKVRIDKEIAPLLSNMWKMGIRTVNSCQAHCSFKCDHKIKKHPKDKEGYTFYESLWTDHCQDCIWLVFEHALDIELFYNIVAEYLPYEKEAGTMYAHIQGHDFKKNPRDVWSVQSSMRNYGVEGHFDYGMSPSGKREKYKTWHEDSCKNNIFILQPQLTFPRKHLAYVEAKIKEALKTKPKKKK